MTNRYGKFSLVMPCYGKSVKYLKRAVESILDQRDYDNWELIVVFDGESKEGVEIMTGFTDPRIRHITIEHAGACAARNAGQKLATGDYYSFFSSDFIAYPGMLFTWDKALTEHPEVGFVYSGYDLINEGAFYGSLGSHEFDARQIETGNYIDGGFPIRKEDYVPWDETVKSLNDWDWWIRIIQNGVKGLYIPDITYSAEIPKEGGLSEDSANNWLERVTSIKIKNNIKLREICVTSLGAQPHAKRLAEILDADFVTMPSYKPHNYRMIYLLGFYMTNPAPHAQVFANDGAKDSCVKAIHWIGSDAFMLNGQVFDQLRVMKNGVFDRMDYNLAEYPFTRDEVANVGIVSKVGGNVPMVPFPIELPSVVAPLPEKFTVAIYMPLSQGAEMTYLQPLMRDLTRALPDVKFIFFGGEKGEYQNVEGTGWCDIKDVIAKSSMLLRLTIHDGLPVGPIQFLMNNRQVLTNTPMPYVEFYNMLDPEMGTMCNIRVNGKDRSYFDQDYCFNKDALIDRIRKLQKGYGSLTYNWNEIKTYYQSICGVDKFKDTVQKMLNREKIEDAVQCKKYYDRGCLICPM